MYYLTKSTQTLLSHRGATLFQQAASSTNAALDLHHHFWDSFENRSLMHGKQCDCEVLPSVHEVQKDLKEYTRAQDQLMKNAHEDLFKHFRMNASLRAMKRGDGILSDTFELAGATEQFNETQEVAAPYIDREMTLIDMETQLKAREDMHLHLWRAHESRKEIAAQHKADEEVSAGMNSPHAVYPDKTRSRTPLPSTLQDIQLEFGIHAHNSSKSRAIAITEPTEPFKIVDVNKAWIDLCGYSRKHAVGSTLKLLQGPETNVDAAKKLAKFLLAEKDGKPTPPGNEYETVLTNYRSDGNKFRNHVRVGVVRDDSGEVVNFVGVFRKLDDNYEMII